MKHQNKARLTELNFRASLHNDHLPLCCNQSPTKSFLNLVLHRRQRMINREHEWENDSL